MNMQTPPRKEAVASGVSVSISKDNNNIKPEDVVRFICGAWKAKSNNEECTG